MDRGMSLHAQRGREQRYRNNTQTHEKKGARTDPELDRQGIPNCFENEAGIHVAMLVWVYNLHRAWVCHPKFETSLKGALLLRD